MRGGGGRRGVQSLSKGMRWARKVRESAGDGINNFIMLNDGPSESIGVKIDKIQIAVIKVGDFQLPSIIDNITSTIKGTFSGAPNTSSNHKEQMEERLTKLAEEQGKWYDVLVPDPDNAASAIGSSSRGSGTAVPSIRQLGDHDMRGGSGSMQTDDAIRGTDDDALVSKM